MSTQSESGRVDYPKSDHAPEGTKMAGDVVPFPSIGWGGSPSEEKYKSQKLQGDVPAKPFDPLGDMSGGGKVIPGPGYTK